MLVVACALELLAAGLSCAAARSVHRDTQLRFQLADLGAERGLTDTALRRGAAEMARLRQGEKVSE